MAPTVAASGDGVEAYIPNVGWYSIEPTYERHPWPSMGQIQVSIVPAEYEDKRAGERDNAAPGVPYLSLTESLDSDG